MSPLGVRATVLPCIAVSMLCVLHPLRAAVRCVPLTHPGSCDSHHATIQQAVDQAAPAGDVVRVAAGTYAEQVVVAGKSVELLGARAGEDARGRSGSESVITHPDGPLSVCGNDVVVDGFTLAGATNPDAAWGGLELDQSPCSATGGARIENNIVRDNIVGMYVHGTSAMKRIRTNWIKDNAVLPQYGIGIESDVATANVQIEANLIEGNPVSSIALFESVSASILGNRFDRPIVLVHASGSRVEGNVSSGHPSPDGLIVLDAGTSSVLVTRNTLRPSSGKAIALYASSSASPNQAVTVRENCIEVPGGVGLEVTATSYSGPLDAASNWWGSASGPSGTGPGTGAAIVDPGVQVGFVPFETDARLCDCSGRPDGAACEADGYCTTDSCAGGVCVGILNHCDDGDDCTVDRCEATTGECEHDPLQCDDENTCTDDGCDPSSGCTFTPNDANACQADDLCLIGACLAGACSTSPRVCDDGSACTTDSCTPSNGQCVFAPRTCDDGNSCTDDSCNPATGTCIFTIDDGNACTNPITCALDHCSAGACVAGGGPAFCDDGVACTMDSCDTQSGQCVHAPDHALCGPQGQCAQDVCTPTGCVNTGASEWQPCSDDNACTLGDTCHSGHCVWSFQASCACGVCIPPTGCPCNDGNPCTSAGCNVSGVCTFAPLPGAVCNDGNPCTSDVCNASGQCAGTAIGPPGEIGGVKFAGDRTTLAWTRSPRTDTGIAYELARGAVAALPVGSGPDESCTGVGNVSSVTVEEVPGVATSIWYLIRAQDSCGVGTYGYAGVHGSPGAERVPACP